MGSPAIENSPNQCLICCGTVQLSDERALVEYEELLKKMFSVFSTYMKWELPTKYQFNFQLDKFPFCKSCLLVLIRMNKLNDKITSLMAEIKTMTLLATKKILLSEPDRERRVREFLCRDGVRNVGTKYNEDKVLFCRNITLNRYLPTVRCERVDDLRVLENTRNINIDSENEIDPLRNDFSPLASEDDDNDMVALTNLWKEPADHSDASMEDKNTFQRDIKYVNLDDEDNANIANAVKSSSGGSRNAEEVVTGNNLITVSYEQDHVMEVFEYDNNIFLDEVHHEEEVVDQSENISGVNVLDESDLNSSAVVTRASNRLKRFAAERKKGVDADTESSKNDVIIVDSDSDFGDTDIEDETMLKRENRKQGGRRKRCASVKISDSQYEYRGFSFEEREDGTFKCCHCASGLSSNRRNAEHHVLSSHIVKRSSTSTGNKPHPDHIIPTVKLSETEFQYGDNHTYTLINGKYQCGHCTNVRKLPNCMRAHIREAHMDLPTPSQIKNRMTKTSNRKTEKTSASKKPDPNHIIPTVKISETEFKYGDNHTYSLVNGKYHCGHCTSVRRLPNYMRAHIRDSHMGLKTPSQIKNLNSKTSDEKIDKQPSTSKGNKPHPAHIIPTVKLSETEYQYGDSHTYSLVNGKYQCGHCRNVRRLPNCMRAHIRDAHMGLPCPSQSRYRNMKTPAMETARRWKKPILPDDIGQRKFFQPNIEEEERTNPDEPKSERKKFEYEVTAEGLKCCTCEFVATSYRNLKYHIDYKHIYTGMVHICEVCGKGFNIRKNFLLHQTVHLNTRDFMCEQCGKSFKCRPTLQSHKKLVHGDQSMKKIVCDYCGKKFLYEGVLKIHLQSAHSIGDRPMFTCEVCGKILPRFSKTRHLRTHYPDRCKTCPECGKQYINNRALVSHMTAHHNGGSKRFKCKLCGLETVWYGVLFRHAKRVHGITNVAEYNSLPSKKKVS